MKRLKVNTSWEEDEEERRQFYSGLSYRELLQLFVRSTKACNFHPDKKKYGSFTFGDHKTHLKGPYRIAETPCFASLQLAPK